jgi:hypothetical protein
VFGDGRPQCGALILPSEQGRVLAEDRKAFLDALWPVIAEANAAAPTHSRILPEMIEIIPYGTEIPVVTFFPLLVLPQLMTSRPLKCQSSDQHAIRSFPALSPPFTTVSNAVLVHPNNV